MPLTRTCGGTINNINRLPIPDIQFNNVDNVPQKPKKQPLQFKRGTSLALKRANILLLSGQPAVETDTHRLKIGDGRTRYNSLPYIGDFEGKDGKSAYQLWQDCGNSGSVEDFLNSLVGEDGKSTYEIWLSLGNEGNLEDFIDSLKGKSAFEIWRDEHGTPESTVDDFMNYLVEIGWGEF